MPTAFSFLVCKDCKIVFIHTNLGRSESKIHVLLPQKFEFPLNGKHLACPHCSAEALYTVSDLKYDFLLDS